MTDMYEPEDGLTRRLRALGELPIDSATQSRHLTAMAEAAAAPSLLGTFGNRVRIAVALIVGFLLGTTGLASAGALGPLQPIASETLSKVGVNVPEGDAGTERFRGDTDEPCADVEYKNHGQYVKAVRAQGGDAAEAAASRCGKPVRAGEGDDDTADAESDADGKGGKPDDAGKPENPGKSEEKKAAKADKASGGDAAGDAKSNADGRTVPDGSSVAEEKTADTPATTRPADQAARPSDGS
ncbi:MAG TPA: hypothetical protein VM345_11485 [Acidimicrobiales bacterium]|nr:hypothetical protein [Acidimicrobiales bacterium]